MAKINKKVPIYKRKDEKHENYEVLVYDAPADSPKPLIVEFIKQVNG